MPHAQPAPLEKSSLVDTPDVDEARDAIGRIFCPHFLTMRGGDRGRFHARHNSVREPGYSVNFVSYGAEVEIDPGELSGFFLLQIPTAGSAQVRCGSLAVEAEAGRMASLLSPTLATRMRWAEGCEKLIVLLRRDAMERLATQILDDVAPLEFDTGVDLTSPVGQVLQAHAGLMLAGAESERPLPDAYKVSLRDAISTLMITGLRHNRSGRLSSAIPEAGPPAVRRARAFIMENADKPLSMADISEAAGVPLRTLQDSYRRVHGITLSDALTLARLDLLRLSLLNSHHDIHVADAVLAAGFGHLGRAAAAYRTRFGESPSETLRRAQRKN
ncbi:AraC family transcriptional regulator [Rhizobium sp. FY34]|uniref:AraC family transcriptional regulator n=1 Tax=Rhizobium sp. FY34 TaxID=2562309 RepID=UPI0010BFBA8F|nr:AraC family transcriptional regulator [Rhizobium sp. FY34]